MEKEKQKEVDQRQLLLDRFDQINVPAGLISPHEVDDAYYSVHFTSRISHHFKI